MLGWLALSGIAIGLARRFSERRSSSGFGLFFTA
jgi:hypothetical protein